MKLVRDHLYIGNITDANAVLQSSELKVTHMLSLLSNQVLSQQNPKPGDPYALVAKRGGTHDLPTTKPAEHPSTPESRGSGTVERQNVGGQEIVRMTVPLRDMEKENLLDHLETCLDFIEEGRTKGDVLVHCVAGVSRSASVITAYLMRTEKLSVDDALASLREGSPHVCPNEGFMEQLKMFEDMGFKVDRDSPIYKQFHVTNLGGDYRKGEKIESSRFASDPGADSTSLAESIGSQLKVHEENRVATLYRCRKCRRLVASQSNVISHSSGLEEPLFKSKRRSGGRGYDDEYGEPKCSSIFVEPMQWMTAVIEGHVEGKLFCASCQARLGNFHWAGLQCSCGAWVNPAFQLHKSRMDLTWT
ncbi:unnamed protein product [Calypogeia fissa]